MEFLKLLKQYDYSLPKELIAQQPSLPRDSARLLVYCRGDNSVKFDAFKNINEFLPKNSVLIFNQTKVVPARLILKKPTGGRVEILYIDHNQTHIKVLANKKLSIGQNLPLTLGNGRMTVVKKQSQFYFLKPNFSINKIRAVMAKYGKTPLPPYIKNSLLSEKQKRQQYQTVFAKTGLSVAAPTASLHFTKNLMAKLQKQGINVKFVTLNVNLGTFAPLKEENLKTGKLHLETYEIDKKTAQFLNQAKKQRRPIVAVGTTVVRTLESAAKNGQIKNLSGDTNLFITPGYQFKFVDCLITNFHVPKSSLMMLTAAFLGRKKLLKLYKTAIRKRFKFFSFGDGMIIL